MKYTNKNTRIVMKEKLDGRENVTSRWYEVEKKGLFGWASEGHMVENREGYESVTEWQPHTFGALIEAKYWIRDQNDKEINEKTRVKETYYSAEIESV